MPDICLRKEDPTRGTVRTVPARRRPKSIAIQADPSDVSYVSDSSDPVLISKAHARLPDEKRVDKQRYYKSLFEAREIQPFFCGICLYHSKEDAL